jgi:hypothetical protein
MPESLGPSSLHQFVKLVERMRKAQEAYFLSRTRLNLIKAKVLEKQVDRAMYRMLDTEPELSLAKGGRR